MRVNLARKETGVFSINWIRIGVTILIVVLIAGLAINYYILRTQKSSLNKQISSLNQQLKVLTPKKEEYLTLREQVSQLEADVERIEGKYVWPYIAQETGYVIPESVNLKTFSINENKLTVSGSAANTELLIDYIDNMNQSPYFSQVTLQNYLNQEKISFDLIATMTEGGEDDVF